MSCLSNGSPILVFTDGASEAQSNAVGGIIISPFLPRPRFFGVHVPNKLVELWRTTMKHIIGPVELYAIVLARHVWNSHMMGGKTIFFIDSYVAMDSCIRGTSSNEKLRRLLLSMEEIDARGHAWGWYCRVPSKSNPADEPSRGVFDGILAALNADRDHCSCPITGIALSDLESPL